MYFIIAFVLSSFYVLNYSSLVCKTRALSSACKTDWTDFTNWKSFLPSNLNPHMHEIFLQHYCMKWVPGPTKENAELNRQNNFSFTYIKLVYCLRRKRLWCNSLVQKMCMLLAKETVLATSFTQKMQKSSDFMFSC